MIVFYLPGHLGAARPRACCSASRASRICFDGYLARRLGQTSNFGAFLDPVADKLIVSTALVLLVQRGRDVAYNVHFDLGRDPKITLALVAAVIIGREITVSALREWMSQIGARAHVAVNIFGKWKTTLQIIGISLMLYREPMLGARRLRDRRSGSLYRRRGAHAMVDDRLPASGVADHARQRLTPPGRSGQRSASRVEVTRTHVQPVSLHTRSSTLPASAR